MTASEPEADPTDSTIEPIVDYETLRERDDVRYDEERDVVDEGVVEQIAALPDMAGVGIVNDDGELLFRRLTETCSWKIPVANVGPGEDFAAAIRTHVRETIGFDLELDGVASVWEITVETDDGERSASRAFVVFGGAPASGEYDLAAVEPSGGADEAVEDADWFGEVPDDADGIPGTEIFLA